MRSRYQGNLRDLCFAQFTASIVWATGSVLLIAKGADVNVKNDVGYTPLDWNHPDTAALLRKHGGKTGEELKAEGK